MASLSRNTKFVPTGFGRMQSWEHPRVRCMCTKSHQRSSMGTRRVLIFSQWRTGEGFFLLSLYGEFKINFLKYSTLRNNFRLMTFFVILKVVSWKTLSIVFISFDALHAFNSQSFLNIFFVRLMNVCSTTSHTQHV